MVELGPREREILCLAELTNREIAARLGITHQTVKNHLTHVYGKLGIGGNPSVHKRIPALMLALRLGLLTLDEIELPLQRLPVMKGVAWDQKRFAQVHTARWREIENVLA